MRHHEAIFRLNLPRRTGLVTLLVALFLLATGVIGASRGRAEGFAPRAEAILPLTEAFLPGSPAFLPPAGHASGVTTGLTAALYTARRTRPLVFAQYDRAAPGGPYRIFHFPAERTETAALAGPRVPAYASI